MFFLAMMYRITPARHRIPADAGAVAWAGVVEGHGTGRFAGPTRRGEDRVAEPGPWEKIVLTGPLLLMTW